MDIVKLISADHIPVKMRRCDLSCPFSAVRIVIASQHILVALCLTICICGFSSSFDRISQHSAVFSNQHHCLPLWNRIQCILGHISSPHALEPLVAQRCLPQHFCHILVLFCVSVWGGNLPLGPLFITKLASHFFSIVHPIREQKEL